MDEKIEVLITANEYMEKLISGTRKVIDLIDDDNMDEAYNIILYMGEGIAWISDVIRLTKDVHREEIDLNILNEKLNEIVEALENGDNILLRDLFNYEILPELEKIHRLIKIIISN